jgi:hypothetical protein
MPQRSQPGERRGGRQKGTPNKATVAKLLDAKVAEKVEAIIEANPKLRDAALQPVTRRVRAKDELIDLIPVVKGHVAQFQQVALTMAPGTDAFSPAMWDRYERWLQLLHKVCDSAADFQDPRLKAQLYVPPPPDMPVHQDGPQKVVRLGSATAASRAYQQFMLAPRQKVLPPPSKRSA